MGWTGETWTVEVNVCAHGGDRETTEEILWEEMRARLQEVADDARYATLLDGESVPCAAVPIPEPRWAPQPRWVRGSVTDPQ